MTFDKSLRRFRGLVILLLMTTTLLYLSPQESFASEYSRSGLANAWIIPASESPMNWHSDDRAWNYSLPFPFPFFSSTNTVVWISSNGLISLGGSDATYANGIAALAAKRAIAVLWDDLMTNNSTVGTDIFIQPNATYVMIRWKAVTFPRGGVEVNFEALLGADGTIQFNYGPNNGPISATVGISDGQGKIIASDITTSNFIDSILFTPTPGKPSASFTYSPSSPRVGDLVTFNASSSQDNGLIVSYNWTFGDGSPSLVEADPATNHTYTGVGVFSVILTVTDDDGLGSSILRNLIVTTTGVSPLASFTAVPPRAVLGQSIIFNASASRDPDGGLIVGYRWTLGDGNNATGPVVTHLYMNTGTYLVGLTVTDDEGSVSSIDGSVSVVVADVRLLDAYSQFRTLKLRQENQVTLFAEAMNIGSTPVYVLARFRVMDLKTGTLTVFSSNATELSVRDQYMFRLNHTPPVATARYLVLAIIYLSGEDLAIDSPLWVESSQASFVIRVTR